MQFKDAESFSDIEVGDLVRVQRGPLESSTPIVSGITRTTNTICPMVWWPIGKVQLR
jgi:transcription antitermination factor NusG